MTDEECFDDGCRIGACRTREKENTENNRVEFARTLEEENDVRIEAEKIVIEILKKKKSILRYSTRYVAAKAKDKTVIELAQKRVAKRKNA